MKILKRHGCSLLEGPLLFGVIRFAVPIILTSVFQLLFNAADLIVVGKFCGSISVGAIGATSSLTALLVNLFAGLSVGVGVSVAHGIGRRDDQQISDAVHTAVPLALVCGMVLTVVGIVVSERVLILMGTPENTLALSVTYIKIYFCGITFTLLYNFCAAILHAAGDTKSPLIFLTIAGVINVVLNVIFVAAFDMNVGSVALATSISQAIAAVQVLGALMRRTDACRLEFSKLRIYRYQLPKIFRMGLPAGIQSSLIAVSDVIIQSAVNSFGDAFVSGNAAATNLEGFLYMTLLAFYQTAMNYVGQNVGARQYRRANNSFWICQGYVVVLGIIMGSLLYRFGEPLLGIYISDSPEAIRSGMIHLLYVTLPHFILGALDVSTGALRGYGQSFVPLIMSVLGLCGVRVLWVFTVFQIPTFHTPQWLFLSYPASWIVTLIAQMILFFYVSRKCMKQKVNRM